jgi:hypothetical protein
VRPEGLGKLKKFFHLIGSRTRDLPACSIVRQLSTYFLLVSSELNDTLTFPKQHFFFFISFAQYSYMGAHAMFGLEIVERLLGHSAGKEVSPMGPTFTWPVKCLGHLHRMDGLADWARPPAQNRTIPATRHSCRIIYLCHGTISQQMFRPAYSTMTACPSR